ncbi:hypothetical protein ACQCLI_18765 [Pseudomonas nitroreducens]|uniref:hypothetical protein n=1 Tax=Pseudomonas TaxID=286 RepID=UPI0003601979|nr:hypothetical protein [Pseudomonas nitroreducens]
MHIDNEIVALTAEVRPQKADIQALKTIISALVEQLRDIQGHLNLDAAEVYALKQLNGADSQSPVAPNPILIARFFSDARRR